MIHFKTAKENQTDRIFATLQRLYTGKPVGSVAIGEVCKMEHAQVLKYLHRAKDEGRASPVMSGPDGIIRGWVPASAAPSESIIEQNARRAAEVVKQLSTDGELISANTVARQINAKQATVARWLTQAERMKLVRSVPYRGCKPA